MSDSARKLLTGEFQPRLGNKPEFDPYLPKHLRYLKKDENKPPVRKVNKLNEESHTVFFYNISYDSNADHFKAFVSEFGEISKIVLISKKGQAFVTFYDIRNAINCVQKVKEGLIFDQRKIFANFALEKENNEISSVLVYPTTITSFSNHEVESLMSTFGDIRSVNSLSDYLFKIKYFDFRSVNNAVNHSMLVKTLTNVPIVIKIDNEDNEKNKEQELKQNFRKLTELVQEPVSLHTPSYFLMDRQNQQPIAPSQQIYGVNPYLTNPYTYYQPYQQMKVAYSPPNMLPVPPQSTGIQSTSSLNFLQQLITA